MTGESPVARNCLVCGKRGSSDLKPVCTKHLTSLPYVAEIRRELAARENEIEKAASGRIRCVKRDGTMVDDVLLIVKNAERGASLKKISRLANIPLEAARAYVAVLRRAKRVSVLKIPGKDSRVLYLENSEPGPLPE